MGEYNKDELYVLTAESFKDAVSSFKALAMLDGQIQQSKSCPYSTRAEQIVTQMRKFAQDQLDAESEYEAYKTMFNLDKEGAYVMRISESSEKMRESGSKLVRLLVELDPLLDQIEINLPITQNQYSEKQRKKLPLKYKDNTFTYGNRRVDAPTKGNMAIFCDYFYRNCTASCKIPLSDALTQMQKIIPNTTETSVRQWITDFNRWARRPANFYSQIGKKGHLLRVKDRQIEKIK